MTDPTSTQNPPANPTNQQTSATGRPGLEPANLPFLTALDRSADARLAPAVRGGLKQQPAGLPELDFVICLVPGAGG